VFGDGSGNFHDGGFLEGVGADHPPRDLPGDGHHRHAVHHGVRKAAHEVGGAGAGGGDAHAGEPRRPRVALGREHAALLMAREHVANGRGARERLVDLHRRAARVGEDGGDALALQRLHEDVGTLARLAWLEAREEGLGGRRRDDDGGWCGGRRLGVGA